MTIVLYLTPPPLPVVFSFKLVELAYSMRPHSLNYEIALILYPY